MAFPNQDLLGQTVHSLRRTNEGVYFLSPRPQCRKGLAYTYGLGVEASGVVPHVETTMSNHRQGVFTCLTGWRSRFHERHHGTFAEQYNGLLGRCGFMWDHRGPADPVILPGRPVDMNDASRFCFVPGESKDNQQLWRSRWDEEGLSHVERTIVYDLLNPVAAHLVDKVRAFPGFQIIPDDWGRWQLHRRPYWFAIGYQDASAFLPLPPPEYWDNARRIPTDDTRVVVHPDTLAELAERREWLKENEPHGQARRDFNRVTTALFCSPDALADARTHYTNLVATFEDQFRDERRRASKRVKGARRLKTQDPFHKPKGPGPIKRSRSKPRYVGDPEDVRRAHKAYRNFCTHYWQKLDHFLQNRDFSVVFPAGTVRMASIANVRCRGAPLPDENPML